MVGAMAMAACGDDTGGSPDGAEDAAVDSVEADTGTTPSDSAEPDVDTTDGDGGPTVPPPCSPVALPAGVTVVEEGRYRRLEGLPTLPGLPARVVTVRLPEGYAEAGEARYPVLYMHDGQNLFDPSATPFGEWGVDEVMDGLVTAGVVPATIVVGVHNTSERVADYTPTPIPELGGGNAAAYADWLAGTLKPIVDGLFRTRCEREHTAVAGSSLGGLVSLYLGMRHPDHFGRLGVVSPSLWWDEQALLAAWEAYDGVMPMRLWVDMGTNEGGADPVTTLGDGVAEVRRAVDRALARGLVLGRDVALLEDLGAVHNEGAWRGRLPAILGFLLSDDGLAAFGDTRALLLRHAAPGLYVDVRPRLPVAVEVQVGARPRLGRMTVPPSLAPLTATGVATLDAHQVLVAGAAGDTTLAAAWDGLTVSAVVPTHGAGLVPVSFNVKRPASTPADAVVHVLGDAPGLGLGTDGGVPLAKSGDRFIGELPLATSSGFTYNYTLGSAATWETDEGGAKLGPRSHAAPDPAGTTVVTDSVKGWLGPPSP